jgi:hypothetical protein
MLDKPMITLDNNHVYHDEAGAVIPGVTSILREAGLIDASWFTDRACQRGRFVHEACALYDRDDLDESSLDPEIEPYVRAWIAFRKDTGFAPVLIEEIVFNEVFNYAGTLDVAGHIHGTKWILDRKSGSDNPAAHLQTAAYNECLCVPEYRRGVIELDSDGKYKLIEHKNRNDIKVFLAALAIVNWKNNQRIK